MCGEKGDSVVKGPSIRGSPPRVRGKADRSSQSGGAGGITPACAGKSATSSLTWRIRQDHPRVCGEKSSSVVSSCVTRGSPPRVRGKVLTPPKIDWVFGITPACAGKRIQALCLRRGSRDHPRVCGEKTKKVLENSELLIPCVSDFIEFLINPECGTTVLQGSVKPLRLYVKIVRQRL